MVIKYPRIERSKFREKYHGISVPDPYRYMEDPENITTKQFVDENNKLVENYLDNDDIKFFADSQKVTVDSTPVQVPWTGSGSRSLQERWILENNESLLWTEYGYAPYAHE